MTVSSDGQLLVIDAGSGIVSLGQELKKTCPNPGDFEVSILISHLHLDHIIGLSKFIPVWSRRGKVKIYTVSRDERPLNEQVTGIFGPPYWPISISDFPTVEYIPIELNTPFDIGVFKVTAFLACHPNFAISFHVTDGRKKLVHLLDSEVASMDSGSYGEMVSYCRDADVVIADAAYSSEHYLKRKGWGHSTVEDGIRLADACGCKRVMFAHYDQEYTDADLDEWQKLTAGDERFIFTRDGMELVL